MKISIKWLREFIPVNIQLSSIIERLTLAGIEVEAVNSSSYDGQDAIIELGITPNRGDCLSVLGIARELSALCGYKLRDAEYMLNEGDIDISSMISVKNNAPEKCLRYYGMLIKGVKVSPSPKWLQDRLKGIDIKPINNIVDITNLVMVELGHPLHAFDYDRLEGKEITVRMAAKGERFVSLDRRECILDSDMLVIADADKPVALAGVVGGSCAEIYDGTGAVFLEAAFFEPVAIRRAARKLSIHTESSHRFERGVDYNCIPKAALRTASLIAEICGGEAARGNIDIASTRVEERKIDLRIQRVNKLLGTQLERSQVVGYLKSLSFKLDEDGGNISNNGKLTVTVPSFRNDIYREVDLIEEVARIYGYKNIPSLLPYAQTAYACNDDARINDKIRDILSIRGLNEVINYSFANDSSIGQAEDDKKDEWLSVDFSKVVRLKNPLTCEANMMRTTLISGIINTISKNVKMSNNDISIFEIGKVFHGIMEETRVACAVTKYREKGIWHKNGCSRSYYDIKCILELLLKAIRVEGYSFSRAYCSYLAAGCSLNIKNKEGDIIGVAGEVSEHIYRPQGIPDCLYIFELALDRCIPKKSSPVSFVPIPKYPGVIRDAAFIVDRRIRSDDIVSFINKNRPSLLKEIRLFDLYTGKPIDEDKKSVAYSLYYRSEEKTLTESEVDMIHSELIERLKRGLGVTFRD